MTLRSRFTLFTVFWLIFILILYNIFVYFFVIRVTTRGEMQIMANKTDLVVETLRKDEMNGIADTKLLSDMYNANEILRIVNKNMEVVNIVGIDKELKSITPVISNVTRSETVRISGQRVLIYSEPLYYHDELIGVVEGIRRLTVLDGYLQILVGALSATSVGAVVFAIFGTYWFTSRLTGPIGQMVQTMKEIDRSGKLHQVKLGREESIELQQLIRAFNQMIDRLDRTIERQKQFVADASHELKTPLTVIGSYADLLKRWGKDNNEIRDEAIEAIANETERLKKLTHSMLTLAEAEQDDWLQVERFNVAAVLKELANVLSTTFQREIRVHSPNSNIIMLGDKDKIRQLVQILIDNALKYSKEPVDVRIRLDRNLVKLEVTDYGMGIAESEIPFLFERFYRVDEARHRSTGGSGLGLSIAKKIVDVHGGHVEVFSKIGVGTTIVIQFPRNLHLS
ncbi:sensor histidine kinase [Cohnella thailandensis]|jgi:Signal transduction histidine kinase|uniref:Signal transduction histidine-protein kinase ArlS n=1 Tax=Cohnella thailandensis TaxID=557557 RepID=A0A841T676_9BACL|nr:HAMP domain-containing histidine kinase [Cohnella thailandensis]MBB6638356.1 HAMP domain-containing histidine kinase [Cohnella thailandensis]MBP1977166.1 signal transduction histidine kinase [Cohnella thailandensis]